MKKLVRSSALLHSFRVVHEAKKMHVELNEYRYYLEKNVARRTEHLSRRIELLEACNAILCGKLAMSRQELAVSGRQKLLEDTVKLP